jgi:hypothetical protein
MHAYDKPSAGKELVPTLRAVGDRAALREKLSSRYEHTLRRLGK